MKHLFPLMLASMLVTGCTTTRFITRDCVSKEQVEQLRQAEPPKVGPSLTGRADEDLKIVSGSAIRLRTWGRGLISVLEGCSSAPGGVPPSAS